MVRGCPVVTSNLSAMAEVAAGGAILVDPANPNESSQVLERLSENPSFRSQVSRSGLERTRSFSWTAYFRRLIDIYHTVLESKS